MIVNRFHCLTRPLAALAAILLLSVGPCAARAAGPSLPPVVAQLDVLSTPTLGGSGQVIWTGFANEAPADTGLSFSLRGPAGVPEQTSVLPINLIKGQLCEQTYTFQTPQPGDYTINARLKLGVDEKTPPIETVKTVHVVATPAGTAHKVTQEGVTYQTLTLNGPWGVGRLSQANPVGWLTFTVSQRGFYRVWLSQSDIRTGSLYGPNSDTHLLATNVANEKIYIELEPGTYYIAFRSYTDSSGYHSGPYKAQLTTAVGISRFVINNDAAETSSRGVTLNVTCQGNPTYYIASPNPWYWMFGWKTFSPAIPFKLPAGNGPKTIYLKMTNADGNQSELVSDTITLREITPLPVNVNWTAGFINFAGEIDWFRLTVPTDGSYVLETQCGTLQDTTLELLDANSKLIRRDDDSGENYASKITMTLKRNTVYFAKVYATFNADSAMLGGESGTYSIRLKPAN